MSINSKHAYLIIAHNNLELLKANIELIDNINNDIFIHIDKKSKIDNIEELKKIPRYSNIYIYKHYSVYWGHFSQVQTELFLLKKAIKTSHCYYHLISGVDLPLKSQKYIHNFFKANAGKEFIHFEKEDISNEKINWIKYYHIFQKYVKFSKSKIINKFISGIEKIIIFIQKILHINRYKKDFILQSGANWFSITDNFARYIVSKEDWIFDIFKYSKSADELFVQTVCVNSKFKENLYYYGYDDNYISCMRFIDWKRGGPYTFTIKDYDLLMKSDFLWARKFDLNKDKKIIKKIYKRLLEKKVLEENNEHY